MNFHHLDAEFKEHRFNSALLINREGHVEGRYDKVHCLPFGEFIPLENWFPFLVHFCQTNKSLRAGEKFTRFTLKREDGRVFDFGVVICFEDSDPVLVRQYVQSTSDGEPVDFLVNISNDGWFDGTCEHEEHLAISRFRAIECRRALVRSVNMGISAVIDGNGRVQEPQKQKWDIEPKTWVVNEVDGRIPELAEARWHEFKKVAGVLVATVPLDRRASLYAVWGDWLPWGCLAFLAVGWIWVSVCQFRGARRASAGLAGSARAGASSSPGMRFHEGH